MEKKETMKKKRGITKKEKHEQNGIFLFGFLKLDKG